MAEANHEHDDSDEDEPTIEELTEELCAAITEMDYKRLIKDVEKADDIISKASENKRAAYQRLADKGASKAALQRIVASQNQSPTTNNRDEATLKAYERTTNQSGLFKR